MFVAHTAALKITAKPSFPAVRTDNNKSGCLRTKKKKKRNAELHFPERSVEYSIPQWNADGKPWKVLSGREGDMEVKGGEGKRVTS